MVGCTMVKEIVRAEKPLYTSQWLGSINILCSVFSCMKVV